jgi:uncharacterized protein
MLSHSFIHLPGIGPAKERKLWNDGITTLGQLQQALPSIVGGKKKTELEIALNRSQMALETGDLSHFARTLPKSEAWRFVPELIEECAYVDIETTGLDRPPVGHSTTVTFFFRNEVMQEYEAKRKSELVNWIVQEASLVCSFNGASFDIPWLQQEFGVVFKQPHIDLRNLFCKQGLKGGLKSIQKHFHDVPQRTAMDINGFDAVRLWQMYKKGVPQALETLLTYNAEDTVVLPPLLVKAYQKEREKFPFLELPSIPMPQEVSLQTKICPEVYRSLGYSSPIAH